MDFGFDEDVFSFTAEPRHYYRFQCTFPAPLVGWMIQYYDAQKMRKVRVDVWNPPGMGVYFKVEAQETAYVSVASPNHEMMGPYSCQVVDLGTDDHGDRASTATPWSPTTVASGTLEFPSDRDVFLLPLSRGSFYRVRCESTVVTPCRVNVVTPNGTATGDVAPGAIFNATRTGDYVVEVSTLMPGVVAIQGAYTLHLDFIETDDHGDSVEDATPLSPSSAPFTGKLSGGSDRDVFTFVAVQDHVYRFVCDVLPGRQLGPSLLLRDGAGQVVEYSYSVVGDRTHVSVEAPSAGVYSVDVYDGLHDGPYTCAFEDLGFDDHGDSAATATEVSLSTEFSAHLETRADVDVFSFPVQAGRIYQFLPKSGTPGAPYLQLKNAQGQLLQSSGIGNLAHEATEDAQYTLEVMFHGTATRRPKTFIIEALDRGPDDHADTYEGATVLVPGQTVSGWRHKDEDKDVFVFYALEQNLYMLYGASSGPLLESPVGPVRRLELGGPPRLLFDPVATGPIYITVTAGSSYQFRLEWVGVDDHGDDVAHATAITLPQTLNASLESSFDVDVFSAELVAGQAWRVTASGLSNVSVQVVDPLGQPVPVTPLGDFTPLLSGSHHIMVKIDPTRGFSYGPYRLQID
ncbi:hypothetical protein LZ198_16850 [Myxococcus sp. K15C18031901]|uniref:hypothetical protein n=1 Tax=Myxococcus dinghuensis TaxID=2906761 RepID=UPI0020A821B8|nr:hypothetical protein [Myxococcus dinghuensis]MCP3100540.1 hypothetical protein [Myxococcus dinghuensis]